MHSLSLPFTHYLFLAHYLFDFFLQALPVQTFQLPRVLLVQHQELHCANDQLYYQILVLRQQLSEQQIHLVLTRTLKGQFLHLAQNVVVVAQLQHIQLLLVHEPLQQNNVESKSSFIANPLVC